MLVRLTSIALFMSAAMPVAAQTAPAAKAPAQAPAAPSIPRATFLANMDSDFAKMDSNHDGKIVKAEIEASLRASAMQEIMRRNRATFGQLDTDKNGQLSAAEFSQFHADPPPPNATPMLQHFDTNKDATISQVEFRAGTLANFDKLDSDKDGIVSAAEMRAGGIIKK